MVTMQAYEMAIRAVKKHKRVDISYPRALMAVFDLIYPEISGLMNGFDRLMAFVRYRAPSWRNLSLGEVTSKVNLCKIKKIFSAYICMRQFFRRDKK